MTIPNNDEVQNQGTTPMDLRTALRTTGSVRGFTNQRVDDGTLAAILDDARFAPSGGNRQGWRVVVINDPAVRIELGQMMQPVWDDYVHERATGRTPFNVIDNVAHSSLNRPSETDLDQPAIVPNDLLDSIVDAPVVLVIAADLAEISMMDKDLDRAAITGGASIYPFCWNLLLAARSRGLGGVLTTFLARAEPAAAALLEMPATYAIAATIFIGHPVHQPTKLSRRPVDTFTTIGTFNGEPFGSGQASPST